MARSEMRRILLPNLAIAVLTKWIQAMVEKPSKKWNLWGVQNTFFLLAAQVPARRLFHSGFVGFCAGGASDHTLRGCLSGACIRAHPLF